MIYGSLLNYNRGKNRYCYIRRVWQVVFTHWKYELFLARRTTWLSTNCIQKFYITLFRYYQIVRLYLFIMFIKILVFPWPKGQHSSFMNCIHNFVPSLSTLCTMVIFIGNVFYMKKKMKMLLNSLPSYVAIFGLPFLINRFIASYKIGFLKKFTKTFCTLNNICFNLMTVRPLYMN